MIGYNCTLESTMYTLTLTLSSFIIQSFNLLLTTDYYWKTKETTTILTRISIIVMISTPHFMYFLLIFVLWFVEVYLMDPCHSAIRSLGGSEVTVEE